MTYDFFFYQIPGL